MDRETAYNILGVNQNSSAEEILERYQTLLRLYDPDRFSVQDEVREETEKRRENVLFAFRYLEQDPVHQALTETDFEPAEAFSPQAPAADLDFDIQADVGQDPETALKNVFPHLKFLALLASASLLLIPIAFLRFEEPRAEPLPQVLSQAPATKREPPVLIETDEQRPEVELPEALLEPSPLHFQKNEEDLSETAMLVLDAEPLLELSLPSSEYKEKDKLYSIKGENKAQESFINFTPDLIDAAVSCDSKRVETLLNKGAHVETVDDRGDSALTWAIRAKCPTVTKILLKRGANIHARSPNGFTPFVWARLHRNEEIQSILKAHGADTSSGVYWWRYDEDGSKEWIDAAYKIACKNQDCNDRKPSSSKRR